MSRYYQLWVIGWFVFVDFQTPSLLAQATSSRAEIIYHICQRSFFDSDGDRHGDLPGLKQKLDYLQELGVTSILLFPLYESVFYHNYFPIDFETIDPEFGTMEEYLSLVRAVHERGMKIYMDMEIHYITEDHLWFQDSYRNPDSPYSEYILYRDSLNETFESIIFNLSTLTGYDGTTRRVTTLNLHNEKCKRYLYDLFRYWLDPNQDGRFDDGVDGFRIDHMMDDLDWKNGVVPNMFRGFWRPLFEELRAVNTNVKIIGEQAEWNDLGERYFTEADLDYAFAFEIKSSILAMDKSMIINKVDSTWQVTPKDKDQIVFIENHDTHRFMSEIEGDLAKARIGAALNLLLPGIPSIYYGQELGMQGKGGFGAYGNTDANDIPRREAFEWFEHWDREGMALWYKDSGPWWDETNLKNADGISVEEQRKDKQSLWRIYRDLISLRKNHPALASGDLQFIDNQSDQVLSFIRRFGDQELLININLSNEFQKPAIAPHLLSKNSLSLLFGIGDEERTEKQLVFSLEPFAVQVYEIVN